MEVFNEKQDQQPVVQDESTPVYSLLAHGEQRKYITSTRKKTQFDIDATVYAISQPPHPFGIHNLDPPRRHSLHYELTFLSRHALHVRFGLANDSGKLEPFDDDPAFPPVHIRDWLIAGHFQTPEDKVDDLKQAGTEILSCGVELRAQDFNTWVNGRMRGGMEYQHITGEDGLMGFEGFYYSPEKSGVNDMNQNVDETRESEEMKRRKPLWKHCVNGPFSQASMPAGVCSVNEELKCFELFELRTGENLNVAFTERDTPEEPATIASTTAADGGNEKGDKPHDQSDDPDLLFFWTDHNWGCLVKKPLPITIDPIQRLKGRQLMLSIATKGDRMEYIIVAGEAFEKMKARYSHQQTAGG